MSVSTISGQAPKNFGQRPIGLGRNWGWFVLRGVLALILSGAAFAFPVNALFVFAFVFAAFSGADGILALIAGIRGAAHQRHWLGLVLRGIVGIAVPVLFLVAPGAVTIGYALLTLSIVIGWALLSGATEIMAAIELRGHVTGDWLLGLTGLLSVALGIAMLALLWRHPLATLLSVGWLIALWALIAGLAYIALGLQLRRQRRDAVPAPA